MVGGNRKGAGDRYFVPIAARTLDILECFESPPGEFTLQEIIDRTGSTHTTVFRILHTLVRRGYVVRRDKHYRMGPVRRKLTVGYAGLSDRVAISVAVRESLRRAAAEVGASLLVFDNDENPGQALENARLLAERRVTAAIEFQNDVHVGPMIADVFRKASIPLIAIHIPHPGAIYFGPDNYRAGWTAGVALAHHAAGRWHGSFDLLLLLDIPKGGPTLQSRMSRVLAGLEHTLGPVPSAKVLREDGAGRRDVSHEVTCRTIHRRRHARRILISATSDESALGALDAVTELGLAANSAIVGHDGTEEALAAISSKDTSYIGTISFFPETYGCGLMDVVTRVGQGAHVPPAVYVPHELVTRHNIREFVRQFTRQSAP